MVRKNDTARISSLEASKPPLDDEVYNLWVQIHRVVDLIVRARERELSRYGIPIRQVATLFAVHAFGGDATLTRLAQFLERRPHTVSSILTRMEKDGLVKKTNDLARRNIIHVELTEKGRDAYRHTTRRESINAIMGELAFDEQQRLKRLLDRLEARARVELRRRG
ncbi:MAG: MarR family transcriptional regulator [Chloroflexota bacterium]